MQYPGASVAINWNGIRSNHLKGKCKTHLRLIGEFSCPFVASLDVTVGVAVCATLEAILQVSLM
jgi:hypothetical protein